MAVATLQRMHSKVSKSNVIRAWLAGSLVSSEIALFLASMFSNTEIHISLLAESN